MAKRAKNRSAYHYFASCPGLPEWFVSWVQEESQDMDFDEVEAKLKGDENFDGWMRYRLEELELHPKDDWSLGFMEGETPLGVPFVVIVDSHIEHVYVKGHVDLDDEEAAAEERGFWYLANNPKTTKLKNRLMR